MAANVIELVRSFAANPLTAEQMDRVQAIRNAGASYAACIHQALEDCEQRGLSIQKIRESVLFAIDGIGSEKSSAADAGGEQRLSLLEKASAVLTKRELSQLRAFVGIVSIPEAEEKKSRK